MNFTSDGPKASVGNARDIEKAAGLINNSLQGFNPYLPSWEYIPDGEPYVFGDRVYVYGSHDYFNGAVFCLGDYVCYSAPVNDLRDWKYEGVIYESTQEPENPDRHGCLYAPDVTQGPDGRYYLYYVLDKLDIVSVAVCDTPAGKYKFLGYVHYPDGTLLGRKAGDEPQFDPGVLTEGDVTYLYTGFCGQTDKSRHAAMYVKLDKDMLTILDGVKFIAPGKMYSDGTGFEGHAFFEAPSIRKRGDLYYFVYSSEVMHELCYATSEYPDRDFKYGGVIISNCDIGIDSYKPADKPTCYGGNNHGSIIEINNEWYIFYHRQTNGNWFSRQGCLEKIEFLPDGSIKQAEITSCGANNGPLNDIAEYPAYIVCNIFGDGNKDLYINTNVPYVSQDGADGDHNIGYIKNITPGYTLGFKYFDLKNVKGIYVLTQGYGHGYFEVRTKIDGPVLGKVDVDFSDLDRYSEGSIEETSGINAIYLTYCGDGNIRLKSFGFIH
ncbi:MAG: family 43 glycosylhydrolase [Lachnospiraceae bacterium]|nr:family 43 glycosylhydrolase [Lachnospiraceae bacterium]